MYINEAQLVPFVYVQQNLNNLSNQTFQPPGWVSFVDIILEKTFLTVNKKGVTRATLFEARIGV